jgi:hypothetical protein
VWIAGLHETLLHAIAAASATGRERRRIRCAQTWLLVPIIADAPAHCRANVRGAAVLSNARRSACEPLRLIRSGEQHADSDLNLLIALPRDKSLVDLSALGVALEDGLSRWVHLVTSLESLHALIRERVQCERQVVL